MTIPSYIELAAGWLVLMLAGLVLILFGKRILKWILSFLYDLFISHRDSSDAP